MPTNDTLHTPRADKIDQKGPAGVNTMELADAAITAMMGLMLLVKGGATITISLPAAPVVTIKNVRDLVRAGEHACEKLQHTVTGKAKPKDANKEPSPWPLLSREPATPWPVPPSGCRRRYTDGKG